MLQQRTPLPKKRATPRRDERRVQHKRVKPNGRFADSHVRTYWESLVRRCVVCGAGTGPEDTNIHHILARLPEKERQRDHRFVVVLCLRHHNAGPGSVHGEGTEAKFQELTGVDLVEIARTNWSNFNG